MKNIELRTIQEQNEEIDRLKKKIQENNDLKNEKEEIQKQKNELEKENQKLKKGKDNLQNLLKEKEEEINKKNKIEIEQQAYDLGQNIEKFSDGEDELSSSQLIIEEKWGKKKSGNIELSKMFENNKKLKNNHEKFDPEEIRRVEENQKMKIKNKIKESTKGISKITKIKEEIKEEKEKERKENEEEKEKKEKEEEQEWTKKKKELEKENKQNENLIQQLQVELADKNEQIMKNEKEFKDMKEKIKNLEIENKKLITEKSDQKKLSKYKTVHEGIKCEKCFTDPIIGIRYKCSVCKEYNLCEKCEEENEEHEHDFIKLKKKHKDNKEFEINTNNNKIDDDNNVSKFNLFRYDEEEYEKDDNDNYSYKYLPNDEKIDLIIKEGQDKAQIEINLKNDGEKDWPAGMTKLVFNNDSYLKGDDITLKNIKSGEQDKVIIVFKNINKCEIRECNAILSFEVKGKEYGEKLILKININKMEDEEEEEEKEEEENYQKKIEEFRKEYTLSKDDYTDQRILELLKKKDFDFAKTFCSLFQGDDS